MSWMPGTHADGFCGHCVNFFYMFGLLGGAVTSLALGTPMISAVFCHVFHLDPAGQFINVMVIFIWTLVPLFILFLDLKKVWHGPVTGIFVLTF